MQCVSLLCLHIAWSCLASAGPSCNPLTTAAPCSIPKNTLLAKLIQRASLNVWDEAPCQTSSSLSLSALVDIMTAVDPAIDGVHFVGIPVVLGSDFRQVLSVIKHSGCGAVVQGMLKKSSILWSSVQQLKLTIQ